MWRGGQAVDLESGNGGCAGVGTLGLVDADTVDASNLQRQVLHSTRIKFRQQHRYVVVSDANG
jgi:hypothetical protein